MSVKENNRNEESHCLIMESIKEVAEEKLFDGFWFSPGSLYKDAKNVLSAIQYFNMQGIYN